MTFLPSNASEPKSKSNYTMPLDEGQHKLRVLSSAIVGYEGWQVNPNDTTKSTPIRYKMGTQPDKDPKGGDPKYFWAFLVYSYEQERVQIMNITQKTIREQIQDLIDNEAWGDPHNYDITLTRKGMKLDDTKYTVMPNPKTNPPQIDTPKISLDEWMTGADPFETSDTPQPSPEPAPSTITDDPRTPVETPPLELTDIAKATMY